MAKLLDSNKSIQNEDYISEINQGNIIVQHIAQTSSNNLDTQKFTIDGENEDVWGGEEAQKIFKRSRWKQLKKKLGKNLSLSGTQFIIIEKFNDNFYIDFIIPTKYEFIGEDFFLFVGLTGRNISNQFDISHEEVIVYEKNKKGFVTYVFGHYEYDGESQSTIFIKHKEKITTKWKIIPVVIFKNNADGTSDVDNGNCQGLVENINYISNLLSYEIRDCKTFTLINSSLAQDLEPNDFLDAQKRGVLKMPSPDNIMGQSLIPVQFSAQQIQQNLITINKLQDDLLKFTFSFRDTYNTGTNKHNAEVAISNQAAIEYLDFKREIRQQDWAKVFQIILMVLNQKYDVEPKVKISLSPISENQIKATDIEAVAKIQSKSNEKIAEINLQKGKNQNVKN